MTVTWERAVTEVTWESATAPGVTWTTIVGGTGSVPSNRLLPTPLGDPGQGAAVNDDGTGTEWVDQAGGGGGPVDASDVETGLEDFPTQDVLNDQILSFATDLAAKAPLASPTLTGVPTAPTAPPGTDSTQIATTAFVLANAPSATAVSTVPATTGLDPASTDVEKAPTELAARPSGGGPQGFARTFLLMGG